jgi:hypothetical protein
MRAKPKRLTILLAMVASGTFAMMTIWPGCMLFAPLAADAGADAPVNVGQSIVLQGSASGGSGNYSFSWSPTAGLNNAAIAQPTFTPTTIGTIVFTLTVTDSTSGGSVTDTVTVTVGTTSPPVVANAGTDLTGVVGVPVSLHGSATGGNGQYAFAWTAPANATLTNANTATPTFTPAAVGTFMFTLTVTDSQGLSDTDTVDVVVSNPTTLSSLTWGANFNTGGYSVLAVFSQGLNETSAETAANYRVSGTTTSPTSAALGTDGRTVTLVFNTPLASSSSFDLSVGGGLIDANGNSVAAITDRAVTANAADTTLPTVVGSTWAANFTGSYQLSIVFSEALDQTSAQTLTAYRVNGTATTAQTATLGNDGKTVTVVFSGVALSTGSRIDIGVGNVVKDINGNAAVQALNQAVTANAADTIAPVISAIRHVANFTTGGYQITVAFNEAMSKADAETTSAYSINSAAATSAALGTDGRTVTLVFETAMSIADTIDVGVGGAIKDINGKALVLQSGEAIPAATSDTTAPTISTITWAADYAGGGYQVLVTFNESMDEATAETLTSYRINGTAINPTAATLGTNGKIVTLTFTTLALNIASTLDVSVGTTIKDINGNSAAQALAHAIAANGETTKPSVTGATETDATHVTVVFDEALDETTANVPGSYTWDVITTTSATLQANGTSVVLVVTGDPSTHTLTVTTGSVKDINGNTSNAYTSAAFP